MDAVDLKIGDTLLMDWAFTDDTGAPIALAGFTLLAQVRDQLGTLVAPLTLVQDLVLVGVVHASAATDTWSLGTLLCDVRLTETSTGNVTLSETFGLRMGGAISTP